MLARLDRGPAEGAYHWILHGSGGALNAGLRIWWVVGFSEADGLRAVAGAGALAVTELAAIQPL